MSGHSHSKTPRQTHRPFSKLRYLKSKKSETVISYLKMADNTKVTHKYISLVEDDLSDEFNDSKPNVANDSMPTHRKISLSLTTNRPKLLGFARSTIMEDENLDEGGSLGEENLADSPLPRARKPVIGEYKNTERMSETKSEFEISPQMIHGPGSGVNTCSEVSNSSENRELDLSTPVHLDQVSFRAFRLSSSVYEPNFDPFEWCSDYDDIVEHCEKVFDIKEIQISNRKS